MLYHAAQALREAGLFACFYFPSPNLDTRLQCIKKVARFDALLLVLSYLERLGLVQLFSQCGTKIRAGQVRKLFSA
jgi:hypothetical protein